MASVNKVIIVGNLGRDPETRYMPNGDAITNIAAATTESWRDKETSEKREITEWHRIVFYRKLAEIAGEYLKKGASVYIEGRLQTRKWTDKQNVERFTTEIIADSMQMLGERPENVNQVSDQPTLKKQSTQPSRGPFTKRNKTYVCDMKSRQLLSQPERESETRCFLNGSLPAHAKLATAWSEAAGTMKPFAREGSAGRRCQLLPASGGWGARLNSKVNACELSVNLVNYDKPKMLTGLNQNGK